MRLQINAERPQRCPRLIQKRFGLRLFPSCRKAAGKTKTNKIKQARVGSDLAFDSSYSRLVPPNLEIRVAGIRRYRNARPEPSRFSGFGLGALMLDRHIRRKYGGLRIY